MRVFGNFGLQRFELVQNFLAPKFIDISWKQDIISEYQNIVAVDFLGLTFVNTLRPKCIDSSWNEYIYIYIYIYIYRKDWPKKLNMKTWCSSKSLWILSIYLFKSLGPKFSNNLITPD